MRIHNFYIDKHEGHSTISTNSIGVRNAVEAFYKWCRTSQSILNNTGEFRGRRHDQDASNIREELTNYLKDNGVFRSHFPYTWAEYSKLQWLHIIKRFFGDIYRTLYARDNSFRFSRDLCCSANWPWGKQSVVRTSQKFGRASKISSWL